MCYSLRFDGRNIDMNEQKQDTDLGEWDDVVPLFQAVRVLHVEIFDRLAALRSKVVSMQQQWIQEDEG